MAAFLAPDRMADAWAEELVKSSSAALNFWRKRRESDEAAH